MDVHMPSMDGIEATRRVRSVSPGSRVVIVTGSPLREIATRALAAGAESCLTKDMPATKLIDAILDIPGRATVSRLIPREARIA
jgi:two-component system response regulator DesR